MILISEIPENPVLNPKAIKHLLKIEWYETEKSILRRRTDLGLDIALRKEGRRCLQDGMILYADDEKCIQVEILPCDCIVVSPRNIKEMGIICFEIGNMHLPIYIDEQNCINIAYEGPLYEFLQRSGYVLEIENKKLLQTQMLSMHSIQR